MADEKKLENELLSDDDLDNVAGGTVDKAQMLKLKEEREKAAERTVQNKYNSWGDNRDINPDNMSEAYINGDITGGEDF